MQPTNIPIISEENKQQSYDERCRWTRYWIVDPLDGTKEFIKKNGEFTVNIALIENGKPTLGVIMVPAAGNITVSAPANFEVSLGTTFSTSILIPYTGGELSATPVNVRLIEGLSGNTYSGDITISGGGVDPSITVALSGEVTPPPAPTLITVIIEITNLNYIETSGPSDSQSFELSGTDLNGTEVTVALPSVSDFEISADNTTFFDDLNFPGYDGTQTTIFVRLKEGLAINTYADVITIDGGGADLITVDVSGAVQTEPILGWQLDAENTLYLINFDTTVNGVNEGQYAGTGLDPFPVTGQLNSNAFATTGLSDGNSGFGDTSTTGDFTGGVSAGGVTSGGFYAFGVAPNNHAFGFQSTGADFSPGSITLRLQNQTGDAVTAVDLAYLIYQFNDQDRASSFNFSYSEDDINYIDIAVLDFTSTEVASTSPIWEVFPRNTLISGLNIADGAFFYMRWDSDDISGSGSRDELALDNIRVILNPVSENYVYQAGIWTPTDPNAVITANDNIVVVDATGTLTADMELLDITLEAGAELNVEGSLKVNGNIINDGTLVFISNATTTGQLDTFTGAITGVVEIQRYIPARRAFRFLSSAVTTTSSINANWQEGVNNPDIVTNLNPNPGFGAHITGSTTGTNGFDVTASGNPSLFTLNNTAQAWEAVSNTDVNTINTGKPYRLLVRGDRSIDVTDNAAIPTNTTLRATGTLHTGTFTATDFSEVENEFNFFGNPYPASVDMNDVLAASTNVNANFYYIWDPNLGTRGAYVTVDLPAGTNGSGSAANQYLQPGQAAFVTTLANGSASLQFQETHKNVAAPLTGVFNIESNIDLRLFTADAFTEGGTPSDGLRFKFDEDNTNAITPLDAPKFFNQDENLASSNNDRLWSIESRLLPQVGEILPLFTNQYRHTDYVFEAALSNIEGVTAYLRDTFIGEDMVLTNDDSTIYAFNIDAGNPNSSANDRFEIVFGEEVLGTNNTMFGNAFVLYPNPVQNDNFFIATRDLAGESVTIEIYSMLGQLLLTETLEVAPNGRVAVAVPQLPSGVFTVTLTAKDGSRFTTKLINQ